MAATMLAAAAGLLTVATPTTHAAGFQVTTLADAGPGSLRQAILDANASPGADVITFMSGLQGTIVLGSQLDVSDDLDVHGPGDDVLAVSGNNAVRVLSLHHPTERLKVSIDGLTIRDGAVGQNGGGDTGGAGIDDLGEDLVLRRVRLTNNDALGDGGAVQATGDRFDLTIVDSRLDGNHGDRGGAVYVADTDADVRIETSTISGNTARTGAGLFLYRTNDPVSIVASTVTGNTADEQGGGIAAAELVQGPLTIDHSTISGNVAASGAGVLLDTLGGVGAVAVDSTISGNRSTGVGGGIAAIRSTALALRQTTVARNASTGDGAGLWLDRSNASADGSIVGANENVLGQHHDIALANTSTFSARYSLVSDAAGLSLGSATNVVDTDPQLADLNDNGGPTQTHLPLAGSPVLNAGDPGFVAPPVDDQRGQLRLVGGRIDIGAVESSVTSRPPSAVDDTAAASTEAIQVDVLANDTDPEHDTLRVVAVTQGQHGKVTFTPDGVTYTPNDASKVADTFTYTVTDGVNTATATVRITAPTVATSSTEVSSGSSSQSVYTQSSYTPNTVRYLPNSGSPTSGGAWAAASCLVLGATLLLVRRRRLA